MKTPILSCAILLAVCTASAQNEAAKVSVNPAGTEMFHPVPLSKKRVPRPYLTKALARPVPLNDVEQVAARTKSSSLPVAEIRAFPNPFTTQIDVIITDGALAKSVYKVYLYDVNGKRVHAETLVSNQSVLDVANLDAGVYFLQVERNGTLMKQAKLVKL